MNNIDYQLYAYIAPMALVAVGISIHSVWPYRRKHVARSLVWYLVMVGAFLTANFLELTAGGATWTITWASVSHAFFLGSGLAWLAFALAYAGLDHLSSWSVFRWLTILPVLVNLVIWTNSLHGLFWYRTGLQQIGPYLVMRPDYGPVFWALGVYLYGLLLVGVALIVFAGVQGRRPVQRQTLLVSLGALIPIIFNLVYVFRLFPALRKDYTPVVLALSGLLFFLGVHRYSLFRILPVNRHIVLEDVQSAVIVLDEDGVVWELNRRAEEFLGGLRGGLVGVDVCSDNRFCSLLRDVPLDRRNNFETSRSTDAGDDIFLDVWINPIHQARGKFFGTVVTINDVTAWKQLLKERDHALRELQDEQTRLMDLQMKMRKQNQLATIGQLAAGMAHEISNPLTFLNSAFNEIQRRTNDSDREMQELSTDVRDGLDRIGAVVRSLLDHARGINRREPQGVVRFATIVNRTITLAGPALVGINLEVDVPEALQVRCHEHEISQVLLNLLLNAVHAVGEISPDVDTGEKGISIRAVVTEGRLVCSVSDTGPGVSPDAAETIFEPFFSSKPGGVGTGLGLSISREIVRAGHNGRLFLQDGVPTTFVMELPGVS